jgi:hypothetical protein
VPLAALTPARHAWLFAVVGATAAAAGMWSARGFTVDDALIEARVAHHIATGIGYRFNPDGPVVDCVTPLGWAYVLALGAEQGVWQALSFARALGTIAWLCAAALLSAWSAALTTGYRRLIVPLTLGTCLPLSAWAVSGLETGFIVLLGTLALMPNLWGAAAAGLAAALRPELVPWAVVLSFGSAWARRAPLAERALCVASALLPAIGVAVLRALVFDRAAPLAVLAKPSDFDHGLRYTFGAFAFSGPVYLLGGYNSWRALEARYRAIAVALAAHAVALLGVGGDWMPLWRLFVPALPGVLLLGARLAQHSTPFCNGLRLIVVGLAVTFLYWFKGEDVRGVLAQRQRIASELPALLGDARRIATIDVGWVAAASGRHVVDLSGVTDEDVALLPGGHTSKRLPRDLLQRRDVDALVLLLARRWQPGHRSIEPGEVWRAAEGRVLELDGADTFGTVGRIELVPWQDYVVLRRDRGSP